MIVLQISAPATPEPYQTLSMLHEEMGDSDTAYQVTSLGANNTGFHTKTAAKSSLYQHCLIVCR